MPVKRKLKQYKVRYSGHAVAKVKALSAKGARKQAWDMIASGYTYGQVKKEFLKNAKVERLD